LNEDHRYKKEEVAQRASAVRHHAEVDMKQWQKAHPYKVALCEMGLPNREYSALVGRYEKAYAEDQKVKKELETFQTERQKADQKLELAIRKAILNNQSEYYRCKTRLDELDKILKPKQEQERVLKREQERGRGGGRSIGF
jgi:seryl-tRNA synthetase